MADRLILRSTTGSPYVAKVLLVVHALGLKCTVEPIPFPLVQKKVPTGSVPVLHILAEGGGHEVIPDSSKICRELVSRATGREGLITPQAEAVENLCGLELYPLILWFNWLDEETWPVAIRPVVVGLIPAFVRWAVKPEFAAKKERDRIRERLSKHGIKDGKTAREMLSAVIAKFAALQAQEGPTFPFLEGAAEPNLADFALFPMLAHFVGTIGDFKAKGPSMPSALDAHPRLAAWYKEAEQRLNPKITFEGNEPSKADLKAVNKK
jgi:glutathione S-transferase